MLATGLRVVQLVLLAACALLLYAVVAPHLTAAPTLRDLKLQVAAEPEPGAALDDYAVVWKQNPFGKPPAPKLAPIRRARLLLARKAAVAAVAEVSKLTWRLVTTAAATLPELSVAGLVSVKDGSRRMIRVGDELDDRKVVEIERRRVIFSLNGKFEQLTIEGAAPRELPSTKPGRTSAARAAALPARPRLGASRTPVAPRPATTPQAPSSSQLADVFADQIDLAPGEEVVAVNGLALDDASLGKLANEGGEVVVQIRAANGTEREVVLGASQ